MPAKAVVSLVMEGNRLAKTWKMMFRLTFWQQQLIGQCLFWHILWIKTNFRVMTRHLVSKKGAEACRPADMKGDGVSKENSFFIVTGQKLVCVTHASMECMRLPTKLCDTLSDICVVPVVMHCQYCSLQKSNIASTLLSACLMVFVSKNLFLPNRKEKTWSGQPKPPSLSLLACTRSC